MNNFDNVKYLPIGTVCLLKGAEKAIMINGYLPYAENKVYDYSAVLFPEGLISTNMNAVFNSDQIDKILHVGLVTEESKQLFIEIDKKRNNNI